MRFSKERIIDISRDLIIEDTLTGNPEYQWIDIVGIPERPSQMINSLFFASHSEGREGWDNGFDRRLYSAQVAQQRGWHLAAETDCPGLTSEYVLVTSLKELSNRLFESTKTETDPYVIGVTGSVGKTTSVAFLEHVLKTADMSVVRFYSKRLTPLSVSCHYINRVDKDTAFVVMEYSAYLPDHVRQLATVLPSDLAFLVNIYSTHINPGMFSNCNEIYRSKLNILSKNSIGMINAKVLTDMDEQLPCGWTPFSTLFPLIDNPHLPPTLRTAEMYTLGRIMGSHLAIPDTLIDKAFCTFIPPDKRIVICRHRNRKIFFHGETSGGSRLWSWFETYDDSTPWLFVEELNFADEDPAGFIELLRKVFNSDKTYILDTPTNRERLPVSANYVPTELFHDIFTNKANGYIIFHKAMSSRCAQFDPQTYLNDHY